MRRSEFDGEVELVGARSGGGDVLGILGRERAKGRGELVEGVLVVLLRAELTMNLANLMSVLFIFSELILCR